MALSILHTRRKIKTLWRCVLKKLFVSFPTLLACSIFDAIKHKQGRENVHLGCDHVVWVQLRKFVNFSFPFDLLEGREKAVGDVYGWSVLAFSRLLLHEFLSKWIQLGSFQGERLADYRRAVLEIHRPSHLHDLVPGPGLDIIDKCFPFEAAPVHAELRLDLFVGLKLPGIAFIFEMVKVYSHGLRFERCPSMLKHKIKHFEELRTIFDTYIPNIGSPLGEACVINIEAREANRILNVLASSFARDKSQKLSVTAIFHWRHTQINPMKRLLNRLRNRPQKLRQMAFEAFNATWICLQNNRILILVHRVIFLLFLLLLNNRFLGLILGLNLIILVYVAGRHWHTM